MTAPAARIPRGDLIDIGGRWLHVVRAGAAPGRPLVVLEHGSYGCAADWGAVQERLAAAGLRSLAYDRAGMGYSDPGPVPRDARAVAADLIALLDRLGETGPVVLAGHSMAGLFIRYFALANPDRTAGLVMVDAVMPQVMSELAGGPPGVRAYGALLALMSAASAVGFPRALSVLAGDRIGLPAEASGEKRHVFGLASHARWAAHEVAQWPASSRQAERGRLPAGLPIAVVTAGRGHEGQAIKAMQAAPARAARHGHVEHVTKADHASLLGETHAAAIVRGVVHVVGAVGPDGR